jgi:hypothetical protein
MGDGRWEILVGRWELGDGKWELLKTAQLSQKNHVIPA